MNADSCAEWCRSLDADNSDSIDIEEAYDGRVGQALIGSIDAEGVVSCDDLCETIGVANYLGVQTSPTPRFAIGAYVFSKKDRGSFEENQTL